MINKMNTEDEFTSATVKTINKVEKKRAESKAHYANEDNLKAAYDNIFASKK